MSRAEAKGHWDAMSHQERQRWVRLSQTTELSPMELAYSNRMDGDVECDGWNHNCNCVDCVENRKHRKEKTVNNAYRLHMPSLYVALGGTTSGIPKDTFGLFTLHAVLADGHYSEATRRTVQLTFKVNKSESHADRRVVEHRIYAVCPECLVYVPAGRLAQHVGTEKCIKSKLAAVTYHTHSHNIEGCLRNGSFVRKYPGGKLVQWMNGDCMGLIEAMPATMKQVETDQAMSLIPDCCK